MRTAQIGPDLRLILGLGSALGERGKKSAWAKKKIGGEASREVAQATVGLALLANIFPI